MRAAVLIEEGFQDGEANAAVRALHEAGHQVDVLSRSAGPVQGVEGSMDADARVGDADAARYGIVVIPGGAPGIREQADFARFVRAVADGGGVVGAIGDGARLLIDAEVVAGRRVTSPKSISKALTNASGEWQDADVVVDGGIVTGRRDVSRLMAAVLEAAAPRVASGGS